MPFGNFLSPEKVAAAQIAFNTKFNQYIADLLKVDSFYEQLAMPIDSTTTVEQHNWMGPPPQVKQWVDQRPIDKLRNYNYQVKNLDWANGLEVDANDVDDDRLGIYMPRVMSLAESFQLHKINLLVDYLVNGFATTKYGAGYDGLAFFSKTHKDGDGPTFANFVNHTLDDTGGFDEAYQTMLQMTDERGEPLNLVPTHLIVGPTIRATARNLIMAERLASGASNTNYKIVELIVSPKITDGKWFLCCLNRTAKPLIWQTRRPVEFRAPNGADSMEFFKQRKLFFGADARYNAGYGFHQMVVGSDATT